MSTDANPTPAPESPKSFGKAFANVLVKRDGKQDFHGFLAADDDGKSETVEVRYLGSIPRAQVSPR